MTRAALASGEATVAEKQIGRLADMPAELVDPEELALLRARLDDVSGRPEAALNGYRPLFEAKARPVAAEAQLRAVKLARAEKRTDFPIDEAIARLVPWTADADENIRRFATELTRPRGVWCAPIPALQREPWRALPLLEPLRADASRYVQNSVANWLNDAGKSQGAWVRELGARWLRESDTAATRYVVRRALRSLP